MKAVFPNSEPVRSGYFVCPIGYVHDKDEGRVQCKCCGKRVFSRNSAAMALWVRVHTRHCVGQVEGVQGSFGLAVLPPHPVPPL